MSKAPTHGAEYEKDYGQCSKCECRIKNSALLFPFAKHPDGKMEALPPFCIDKRWCEGQQKAKKPKK